MIRSKKRLSLILAAFLVLGATASFGGLLGDVVKVGGIAFVVDKFGDQINSFVNKLTFNKSLQTKQTTAVVPILSMGGGGYIGAAQVMGDKASVAKCKAVVQIEGNAIFGRNIRAKALVPVTARSVSNIKRVPGVGVSAIIDIRI